MTVANDVKREIKQAKKLRLPGWGIVFVFIGSFVCSTLFDHFGRLDLGLPVLNCIGVLGFIIALMRKLWLHPWFWVTMAFIAALHALLIIFVPWTSNWVPAMAVAGIDSLDFCLILWILAIAEKFMKKPKTAER